MKGNSSEYCLHTGLKQDVVDFGNIAARKRYDGLLPTGGGERWNESDSPQLRGLGKRVSKIVNLVPGCLTTDVVTKGDCEYKLICLRSCAADRYARRVRASENSCKAMCGFSR